MSTSRPAHARPPPPARPPSPAPCPMRAQGALGPVSGPPEPRRGCFHARPALCRPAEPPGTAPYAPRRNIWQPPRAAGEGGRRQAAVRGRQAAIRRPLHHAKCAPRERWDQYPGLRSPDAAASTHDQGTAGPPVPGDRALRSPAEHLAASTGRGGQAAGGAGGGRGRRRGGSLRPPGCASRSPGRRAGQAAAARLRFAAATEPPPDPGTTFTPGPSGRQEGAIMFQGTAR